MDMTVSHKGFGLLEIARRWWIEVLHFVNTDNSCFKLNLMWKYSWLRFDHYLKMLLFWYLMKCWQINQHWCEVKIPLMFTLSNIYILGDTFIVQVGLPTTRRHVLNSADYFCVCSLFFFLFLFPHMPFYMLMMIVLLYTYNQYIF